MEFKDVVDYVSLVAGSMTIFGVIGSLAWGLAERGSSRFADIISKIFAYSLKTAIILLLAAPCWEAWVYLYLATFRFVSRGEIPSLWDSSAPLTTVTSYTVSCLLVIPTYVTIVSCIYLWSLSPLRRLWLAIRYSRAVESDS
jgi:hypothetical protein